MTGSEQAAILTQLTEAAAWAWKQCPGDEGVATYEPPKKRLIGTRAARLRPIGRGRRLGVLVVAVLADERIPRLLAAGPSLRAHQPPAILGYASESARERDAMREAAIKGGFAEGEVVHFNLTLIDPATIQAGESPINLVGGELVVPWRADAPLATAPPLRSYLAERIALVRDGAQG